MLGLILIRGCFSWGETAVLENQIASMSLESHKRHAMLITLLFELDQKIEKCTENIDDRKDVRDATRIFVEKIENAERAFQESYEHTSRINQIFSSSVGTRAWISIGSTVFQIAALAILAWGIVELIERV